MKVIHVLPSIEASWGGPAFALEWMTKAVLDEGGTVEVVAGRPSGRTVALSSSVGFHLVSLRTPWFFSPTLGRRLREVARTADVVHIHGLWSYAHLCGTLAAQREGRPYILRPCGALDPWMLSRRAWKKRPYLHAVASRMLASASATHAMSHLEATNLRAAGVDGKIVVLPHALTPECQRLIKESDRRGTLLRKRLVFLGRMSPQKGLDLLLRAWSLVEPVARGWGLVIAGGDYKGYEAKLRRQSAALGLREVHFVGEVHGAAKSQLLASADIFVFPSRGDNFGLSVLEAASAGCAIVASRHSPWGDLADAGGGLSLALEDVTWAQGLLSLIGAGSRSVRNMGRIAREYVTQRHDPSKLGTQLRALYRRVTE